MRDEKKRGRSSWAATLLRLVRVRLLSTLARICFIATCARSLSCYFARVVYLTPNLPVINAVPQWILTSPSPFASATVIDNNSDVSGDFSSFNGNSAT